MLGDRGPDTDVFLKDAERSFDCCACVVLSLSCAFSVVLESSAVVALLDGASSPLFASDSAFLAAAASAACLALSFLICSNCTSMLVSLGLASP